MPISSPRPRIVGGSETAPLRYPFLLSLQHYGGHLCGASLITASWALTATHCVVDSQVSLLSIGVFRHDLSLRPTDEPPCGETIRVARAVCHEGYNPTTMLHEICLLELAHGEVICRCQGLYEGDHANLAVAEAQLGQLTQRPYDRSMPRASQTALSCGCSLPSGPSSIPSIRSDGNDPMAIWREKSLIPASPI